MTASCWLTGLWLSVAVLFGGILAGLAFAKPGAPEPAATPTDGASARPKAAGRAMAATNDEGRAASTSGGSAEAGGVPASRLSANVAVITIREEITWVTAYSVKRRLKLAEESGADAVVFEMHTPGGELGAVLEICQAIKASPIRHSVAWVHDMAYSGGAVISLACREIVVSDVATFGDAAVIALDATGRLKSMDAVERAKFMTPLLTEIVDSARLRGYDEKLVQGFVTLGVELWLVEDVRTGERMCIDAKEYNLLFGGPPTPSSPALASLPSSVLNAPVSKDVSESEDLPRLIEKFGRPKKRNRPASPAGNKSTAAPIPVSPPTAGVSENAENAESGQGGSPMLPASRTITPELAGSVNDQLTQPSQRRTLGPSDVGQWKLVQYISDGNTIYTLKPGQMIAYGLASGRVSSPEQLQAWFGATNVRTLEPAWSEALVRFLTNPIVQVILTVVFLLALLLEMFHPGLVVPGSVAVVALLLLIGPSVLIGAAGWWVVLAILGGIVMVVIEILILPGMIVFGAVGALLILAGLLGTFAQVGSGGLFPSGGDGLRLVYAVVSLVVSIVVSAVGGYFLIKNLGSLPIIGKLVLASSGRPGVLVAPGGGLIAQDPAEALQELGLSAGQTGRAITPLKPTGKAQFGERVYEVSSESGYLASGASIRVVRADAFGVVVEGV